MRHDPDNRGKFLLIGLILIFGAMALWSLVFDQQASDAGAVTYTKARAGVQDLRWGYDTWSRATSTAGTVTMSEMSPINVLARGVVGDGVTDDTDSLQAVIDEVEALGGGAIYLPARRYLANLVVDDDNVFLLGETFSHDTTGTVIIAKTASSPALSIDGSAGQVDGFIAKNLTFHGRAGAKDYGIRIAGAYRCRLENIASHGFEKYNLYITSTASVRTSYIWIEGFNFHAADSASVLLRYGPTYTTAIYFSNGVIHDKSGGKAIESNGVRVNLSNTWITASDDGGIHLYNQGSSEAVVLASNLNIDSNNSSDDVITSGTGDQIATRIIGTFNCDGRFKFASNDSSVTLSGDSGGVVGYNSRVYEPWIIGNLLFSDSADSVRERNDTDVTETRIFKSSSKLYVQNVEGGIYLWPANNQYVTFNGSTSTGARVLGQSVYLDSLREATSAAGIYADGALLKDGAFHRKVTTAARAADDSLAATEDVVWFTGQAATIYCTLPPYASVTLGKKYTIINADASDSVCVEANGAELLNGSALRKAYALPPNVYSTASFVYIGSTGWIKVD